MHVRDGKHCGLPGFGFAGSMQTSQKEEIGFRTIIIVQQVEVHGWLLSGSWKHKDISYAIACTGTKFTIRPLQRFRLCKPSQPTQQRAYKAKLHQIVDGCGRATPIHMGTIKHMRSIAHAIRMRSITHAIRMRSITHAIDTRLYFLNIGLGPRLSSQWLLLLAVYSFAALLQL